MPEPGERTSAVLQGGARGKILLVVAVTAAVSLLHFLTPTGPHGWHGLHLLYQKLYYVPILMSAAVLGVRGTLATTLAVSLLFFAHILKDWSGDVMRQADQVGEIASFWVIAVASSFLFHRERRALERERVAHEETLSALASSLDLREHETALHSLRVREYTLLLARRMGVRGENDLLNLGMGALLHDVGSGSRQRFAQDRHLRKRKPGRCAHPNRRVAHREDRSQRLRSFLSRKYTEAVIRRVRTGHPGARIFAVTS
jgi:hypothetical protein